MKSSPESAIVVLLVFGFQAFIGATSPSHIGSVTALLIDSNELQAAQPSSVPSFKQVGADENVRVVLVAPATTESQLVSLLNSLRAARTSGSLGKYFTPTTPKAPKGPFQILWVLVMSDAQWATSERAHQYFGSTMSPNPAFEKEYGKRVRACYYYSIGGEEHGTIGFQDDDSGFTSSNYRKVF